MTVAVIFFIFPSGIVSVVSAEEPREESAVSAEDPREESNNELEKIRRKMKKMAEQVGKEAINQHFQEMRRKIIISGNPFVEDSRALTSDDILKLSNIEENVIAQIESRKKAIKAIILNTAGQIEAGENPTIIFDLGGEKFTTPKVAQKEERLAKAFKENRISLNSLVLAIKATASLSKNLYQAANQESNAKKKLPLFVEYTAFVYEMSSIVIEVIQDFTLGGVEEIKTLYDERLKKVNSLKQRITEKLIRPYQVLLENKEITEEEYKLATKQYSEWNKALKVSLDGWKRVFSVIDDQDTWANNIKNKLAEFKRRKLEAGFQLEVLMEIDITRTMLAHLKGLEKLANLELPELLILDEETARDLIGRIDVFKKSPDLVPLVPIQ